MKKLFIGMAVGAVAGMMAYKKMQDDHVPEKALKMAREKLDND